MMLTREMKIRIMKEEPVKKKIRELRCYICKVMMRVNNAFALHWSDCSRQCPAGEADRNDRQDGEGYEELKGPES